MVDKKIQQKDLITVFGVATRGAVGHYLTGRRQPSPAQIKDLCYKLGCTIDALMDDGEVDPVQEQINKIIRAVEQAMSTSTKQFTESERLRMYRVGFAAGLDINISDSQLIAYLKSVIAIYS